MLQDFVVSRREDILARTRSKVAARLAPRPTDDELTSGVPLFLDQLVEALDLLTVAGNEAISATASKHGAVRLAMGFTVAQVVHDYGDICQAVTELADELHAPITVDEFRTLNQCLDHAIAGAVTEYGRLREVSLSDGETERAGILAHEMRNRLGAAMLAFSYLKAGRVGTGGSTAAAIDRNLRGLQALINSSLAEVRIESGRQNLEPMLASEIVHEVGIDAALAAEAQGVLFEVATQQGDVELLADRTILSVALLNLLQNAFKFSRAGGHVSLTTSATSDGVVFAVEDECGGLPAGSTDDLFRPYSQHGANRSGLGLGLSSSRQGIRAGGGDIQVRDLPGKGCIFSIAVPRRAA